MLEDITKVDLGILSLFVPSYLKQYSIREMTLKLGINYSHAFGRVKKLTGRGILSLEKHGQANLISLNIATLETIQLMGVVEGYVPSDNPLLRVLVKKISRVDPFASVGLFGSRVSGEARINSDWDVFVLSSKKREVEQMLLGLGYMQEIHLLCFNESEFWESLFSREDNVVKQIINNKRILYNPFPFYALVSEWEMIKCGVNDFS